MLKDATNTWSTEFKLGEGGFGVVYKGWLRTEFQWVAIKRMYDNNYGDQMVKEQAFYHELNMSHDH